MAYPTLVKSWNTSFNNAVAAAADSARTTQTVIKTIKDLLATAGWSVVQSSNAGVVSGVNYGGDQYHFRCDDGGQSDGLPPVQSATKVPHGATPSGSPTIKAHYNNSIWASDSWTTSGLTLAQSTPLGGHILSASAGDVNYGTAGVRHSWCVLQQTGGMSTGTVQLLFNMNTSATVGLYFSATGSFTGGTVTDRPTATDEIAMSNVFMAPPGTNPARKLHLWYSSDHQCTRIMMCRGGAIDGFLMLDRAEQSVSGWSDPWVAMAISSTAASPTTTDFASIAVNTSLLMTGAPSGSAGVRYFNGSVTFEGWNVSAPLCTAASIGTTVNTFDNTWPVLPMGVAAFAGANSGRLGGLFDIWHAPTGITNADTCSTVVKLGGLVLPWDGSTAVSLT